MAVFTAIAVGLGVLAVAGTVASARAQKKSAAETRRASAAEQRRADIANARERRGQVRNARVARASIEAQAAGSGLLGSSSFAAATSNVTSRSNENLSFLDQNQQLSQQASSANNAAARYSSQAATAGAIANLASTGFSLALPYTGARPQGTG